MKPGASALVFASVVWVLVLFSCGAARAQYSVALSIPEPSGSYPNTPFWAGFADVNNDGLSDLIVGFYGGGSGLLTFEVYLENPNLTFPTTPTATMTYPEISDTGSGTPHPQVWIADLAARG